jgi:hypothetical protein
MKKTIVTVVVLATAALASVAGAGAASATPSAKLAVGGSASADAPGQARGGTRVVGGGIWTYGVGAGAVTSVYENHKFVHSTAVRSSGVTKSSGRVAKGKLAVASRPAAFSGNQAFWNIY